MSYIRVAGSTPSLSYWKTNHYMYYKFQILCYHCNISWILTTTMVMQDCLGALDGTHVRVIVPILDAPWYRGRKDFPTQNVLACCTFDILFSYSLAGWEGSASYSRVLKSFITRDDPLKIPNGNETLNIFLNVMCTPLLILISLVTIYACREVLLRRRWVRSKQ